MSAMEAPGMANDEPVGHATSQFVGEFNSLDEVIEALAACSTLRLRDVTLTSAFVGQRPERRVVYYVDARPLDWDRACSADRGQTERNAA